MNKQGAKELKKAKGRPAKAAAGRAALKTAAKRDSAAVAKARAAASGADSVKKGAPKRGPAKPSGAELQPGASGKQSGAKKAATKKASSDQNTTSKVAAKGRTSDKAPMIGGSSGSTEPVMVEQNVAGRKMTARAKTTSIVLPPDYKPSEDEPFMNEQHRAYFRQKLLNWKDEIIRQTRETLVGLHEESTQHADLADRATSETDRALELRARDRQRKLVAKIDAAIARIDDGSYGYCEDTGEPIGLKRLDARPIATLSVEAQERHERREKVYRED